MQASIVLRSPAPAPAIAAGRISIGRREVAVSCRRQRNYDSIPYVGTFSRPHGLFDRFEPPLLERTRRQIADHCMTLEGDECCDCWKGYTEFQALQEQLPKEEVEQFVRRANGPRDLVDSLHRITAVHASCSREAKRVAVAATPAASDAEKEIPFPVPDGLPKTKEELQEEEEALMPESPYTKLLRSMGKLPAWYTARPDHETD